MNLRRLTPEDCAAYRDVWMEGVTHFPESFLLSAAEVSNVSGDEIARRLDQNLHFGAFEEAGRLQGFIAARRGGTERLQHTADIGPLYVRAEVQGQGLGRRLLGAVLDHLTRAGSLQAELVVDEQNTRAQAMYRAAGFKTFGRRPRSVVIDGVARHDLLMIRALDGADLVPDA